MQQYNIIIDENKKETTDHGSFEFPLAIYTTDISKNVIGFIDWHWHDELQFCFVTKGKVVFDINASQVVLNEGDGLFINSQQIHRAKNYENINSSYICFDFHPKLISSFMGSLINTKYIEPYVNNSSIEYCTLSKNISWQLNILNKLSYIYEIFSRKNFGFEFEIFINFLEIWKDFFEFYFKNFKEKELNYNSLRLKNIITYINNHYMEKIQLEDIAKVANLSKSACCREFKKHMKCTVFEYLINYRLVVATKLLVSSDYSVTEIAYNCGFGTTSYFIEKFKNKTGVSPYVYRKNLRL